jgi:hypothetical protein
MIERFGAAPTGPGGRSLPFTKAVRAGGFIFVSGQLPMGVDGEIVDGNIVAQTRQTIENVKTILREQGLGLEHESRPPFGSRTRATSGPSTRSILSTSVLPCQQDPVCGPT